MIDIDKRRISKKCYEKSEKGRVCRKNYWQSERGKTIKIKYRNKNWAKIKERNRQWRMKNPNKVRKSVLKSPNRVLFAYRNSAKKRGHIFSLTREEFWKLIKGECFYCGESSNKRNGIDRKDNAIGYVIENCVSACRRCNMMKGQMTQMGFIETCTRIANKGRI